MEVIKVENISKQYHLGMVSGRTLVSDVQRFFAKVRGKEDPALKIGVENKLGLAEGDYVWALRDISFGVEEGAVLGIIGKNGAGKSTLLKILSKVTTPTTGQIKIKGRIASLLEVGTGFHPELSGRENIFLNGAILGMTKTEIRAKFDEIVDFAGVGKYIDTPVKRYSSGMYVRLAFAVAAHLEPEILIVDEVLAVGDAEFQRKALGKMQDISKGQGRTVLFVSHNMAAVKSLCKKAILLEEGAIKTMGNVDEIVSYYLTSGGKGKLNYKEFKNGELGLKDLWINSIGARSKGKDYGDYISREDVVEIIIKYNYSKKIADRIDFNLIFKGEDGTYIFHNSTGTCEEELIRLGNNELILTIPDNFLQQGSFNMDLLIVEDHKNPVLNEVDVISFSINPEMTKIGRWMGKTRTYLTPHFNWSLNNRGDII